MSRNIFKDYMKILKIHCRHEIKDAELIHLGKAFFSTLHTGVYFHCTAQVRECSSKKMKYSSPPNALGGANKEATQYQTS